MNERSTPRKKDTVAMVLPALVAVAVTAAIFLWPQPVPELAPRARFAECLTSKNVVMYGQDTCLNCKKQKTMFAEDFRRIHYINCDIHQDECTQKGIQGYPTWMYNGQSLMGVQTFQKLGALSGCAVP